MDEDENFWPASAPSQGPDGVCGPCSEIYVTTPRGSVEVWNLVFTQFNRVGSPPNNLRPLPSKNIDTGMGFERMASVLQGVETNYHIDILRPLVEAAGEVCRVKYEPESDSEIDSERGRRLRRIADHVRACSFAIHENVYPDNEKQGYVVRKLIRRAVLDGYQMGIHEAFLYQLPKVVADLMKGPYPELQETVERVAQGLRNEESQFFEVINAGMPRVERLFEETKKAKSKTVSGRETFNLLQTYGFPPELTETLAVERGLELDWDGFKKAQQKHEEASGAGQRKELFKQGPLDKIRETLQSSEFVGYESDSAEAVVMGLLVNNELSYKLDELDSKLPAVIVLDRTPFYGEMGGQVGDTGWIVGPKGRFEVTDTRIEDDFILHVGHLREGKIEYKDPVKADGRCAAAAGDSPRPLGHAPAAIRLAEDAGHADAPEGLEGRGRPAPLRLQLRPCPLGRAARTNRDRGQRPGDRGRAGRVEADAEGRGPEARGDDALRREVSGHRPRGLDGRVQQGALRRHAPGQHGAGGPVEDHRRREHRQGHPPDHGLDRPGGRRARCSATKPCCGGSR